MTNEKKLDLVNGFTDMFIKEHNDYIKRYENGEISLNGLYISLNNLNNHFYKNIKSIIVK